MVIRYKLSGEKKQLDGNVPAIVLNDIDIAETAHLVFWATFRNSGHIRIAAKRVHVPNEIFDDFIEQISKLAK